MFLDVLFSFQRTSYHLVLATLLVYHVSLLLSNTFLNFFIFIFVCPFRRLYYLTMIVECCQMIFFEILSFLSLNESLVRLSTQTNKKKHPCGASSSIGAGEENRTLTVSLEG